MALDILKERGIPLDPCRAFLRGPVARLLHAEVDAIEEQHVTQHEAMIDPEETWREKWVLHEANEVDNDWSCLQQEQNATAYGQDEMAAQSRVAEQHELRHLEGARGDREPEARGAGRRGRGPASGISV
ncbi:hypothetical protein [Sorangium sp. So ce1389]|uniref:hypothetical protein n=1 Tax=Sorangium sp. So ce1389 TaxID=3133336 RepID=UPI003F5E4010